jgi:hypothetical protein
MIDFLIDPKHVKEAIEQGALLRVRVTPDGRYKRVTVEPKP